MSEQGPFAPEELVFEIDTLGKLRLSVDENGWPVKLGDGTFGVVYQAFDPQNDIPYAVKLLYDNYATQPRDFSRIDETHFKETLDAAMDELKRDPALVAGIVDKAEQAVSQGSRDTADIIERLQQAGVVDWKRVITALQSAATSTAVKRFIDEMEVSRKIRRSLQQNRRSAGEVDGTVEIKGGTAEFHASDAYKKLAEKKFFDNQRTQVSNYALVMKLYRFTLKDLLEKGPGRQRYRIRPSALADIFGNAPPDDLKKDVPTLAELRERIDAITPDRLPDETPNERNRTQDRLRREIESLFGYGLLRSMSIRDRVRTALPYLEGIAKGLLNLHSVDEFEGGPLFHHDIKPANIFVNADPERRIGFDCALGDLGFVSAKTTAGAKTYAPLHDELPLGSLHYRSPEQKEFFDVALVEVRHTESDLLTLIVHDPKFRGSFIETGDSVVFSKDQDRNQYQIRAIDSESNPISITIGASQDIARDGGQTQVIFYKNHGHRTDLFGVGAVLYDMITCGESPERFYESIRRFEYSDDPNRRGQPGSVEDLLDKYSRVSQGRAYADDPSLVQIFEPFRHEASYYADREVVELILKCMLYKAQGAFYNEAQRPEEATRNLLGAIRDLMRNSTYKYNDSYDNPLITLEVEARPDGVVNRFPITILDLQRLDNPALRLARGVYYFERLVESLVSTFNNDKQGNIVAAYLYELLPNRIQSNEESNGQVKLSLGSPTYNEEKDFFDELKNDRIVKLNRDPSEPYVPDHLAFMRRNMQLFFLGHTSDAHGTQLDVEYRFLDASPFGDQVTPGDKLVFSLPTGRRYLGSITDVDKDRRRLSATFADLDLDLNRQQPDISKAAEQDDVDVKATEQDGVAVAYYARLQPARYYLDMLALYLHQLFFAYSPLTGESRDKIDLRLLRESKPGALAISTPERPNRKWLLFGSQPKVSVLEQLHRRLAYMYLKLAFHESPDAYYQGYHRNSLKSLREVIEQVAGDVDILRAEIGAALAGNRQAFKHRLPREEDLDPILDVQSELPAERDPQSAAAANETTESLIDVCKLMRELLAE